MIITRNTATQLLLNSNVASLNPQLSQLAAEMSAFTQGHPRVGGCGSCGGASTATSGSGSSNVFSISQRALSVIENMNTDELEIIKKELRAPILYIYSRNKT